MKPFSIDIKGKLLTFDRPAIMAIVNVTPDSFYPGSRSFDDKAIAEAVRRAIDEGADMIDIGAYSSRPGAEDVSPCEESRRLERGIAAVRSIAPEIPLSVDTFRAEVARKAISEWGADIINDISGGELDRQMFETVAELQAPYILMHMRGTPSTMQSMTDYPDGVTAEVLAWLGQRVERLSRLGVNDVIIDPGFGFSKTIGQNYRLLRDLEAFMSLGRPLLVGISRKSMATRLLGISTEDALNATTVINTLAIERGAAILRVHDVREARQAAEIVRYMHAS